MSTLVSNHPAIREDAEDIFIWKEVRPVAVLPLRGEEYPLLVEIWDNEDDAIYDTL